MEYFATIFLQLLKGIVSRRTLGIYVPEYPSAFQAKLCLIGLPSLNYDIINSSERFLQRSTIRLYSSKLLFYTPKKGSVTGGYSIVTFAIDHSISIRQKGSPICRAREILSKKRIAFEEKIIKGCMLPLL